MYKSLESKLAPKKMTCQGKRVCPVTLPTAAADLKSSTLQQSKQHIKMWFEIPYYCNI
jgi:hypothetical protein